MLKPNNFWHFLGLSVLFAILIKVVAHLIPQNYCVAMAALLGVQVVLTFLTFKFKLFYTQSLFRRGYNVGGVLVAIGAACAALLCGFAAWLLVFCLTKIL